MPRFNRLHLLLSLVFFTFGSTPIFAANNCFPSVSGTIGASATVVNPLGITIDFSKSESNPDQQWLIQFASKTGTQLQIEFDGVRQNQIELIAQSTHPDEPCFAFINADQLSFVLERQSGNCVITVISVSQ